MPALFYSKILLFHHLFIFVLYNVEEGVGPNPSLVVLVQ